MIAPFYYFIIVFDLLRNKISFQIHNCSHDWIERKLFCFARRISADGNAERSCSSIFRSKSFKLRLAITNNFYYILSNRFNCILSLSIIIMRIWAIEPKIFIPKTLNNQTPRTSWTIEYFNYISRGKAVILNARKP